MKGTFSLHLAVLRKIHQTRCSKSHVKLFSVLQFICSDSFLMFSIKVEVLIMEKVETSMSRRSTLSKVAGALRAENHSSTIVLSAQPGNNSSHSHFDSVSRLNLASAIEHGSGRKSLSESLLADPNSAPGNVSLRKQFYNEEENAEDKHAFRVSYNTFIMLMLTIINGVFYLFIWIIIS